MEHLNTVWIKQEETNEILEDPLETSGFTDHIKEDPELDLGADDTENIFGTYTDPLTSVPEPLRIKEEEEVTPKRCTPHNPHSPCTGPTCIAGPAGPDVTPLSGMVGFDSQQCRLMKTISDAGSMLLEGTNLQGVTADKQEIAAGKSVHLDGDDIPRQVLGSQDNALCVRSVYNLKDEEFTCSVCKEKFSSKYRLIKHVFTHIDGVQAPSYICTFCGEVFVTHGSLCKHSIMLPGVNEQEFQCYKISDDSRNRQYYEAMSDDEGPQGIDVSNKFLTLTDNHNPHQYGFRGKTFSQSGFPNKPASIHTAKKSHKCSVCGKSYTQSGNLKIHTLIHTGERPHKCNVCGKTFTQRVTLKNHALIHTGKRPHKCDVCGKSFTGPGHLKNHKLTHTGERPHKCNVCEKAFALRFNLKKHVLIHSGGRVHKCDVCGKTFAEAGHLKSHVLLHTGERPYKCGVCGKSFTQSVNLKTHTLVHTGIRPHKCEVCGKSFTRSGNLKSHLLTHSGKKMHKCDVCGKLFSNSRYVKDHKLIHTRPHKCSVCWKTFTRYNNLKNHRLKHSK